MKKVCTTCMHRCILEEGQIGRCGARKNQQGDIICGNYGWVTSMALDPVEKKPLRRFMAGNMVLSVGSFGCNLSCPFCQNHEISMTEEEKGKQNAVYVSPQELCRRAEELKIRGNIGVAYTYNEPLAGWEYVRDTAKLVHEAGMKNIVVTNGSFMKEVLAEIGPYVDAMNIDLKGFSKEYYRKLGGDLETVKRFIAAAAGRCHVELTTLIVPGENDSPDEMRELAGWIASLSRKIPLHVTRFFPRWKMSDRAPTKVENVYRLAEIAEEYLEYVYTGNC